MLENSYLEYLLVNEIEALKKLKSTYIVKFIDMKLTTNNLYLITEFCDGGDLAAYVEKKGKVTEEEVTDILFQICEAFKEMKRFSMLHRDLKPANILLNNGIIKIADLGFSKSVDNFAHSMNRSTVGSPMYMAPQVLFHDVYTSKCDVWSLGVVLYQLLYGHVPFQANNINELQQHLQSGRVSFPSEVHISSEMKDLLVRCLRYEERDRLSWDDVFAHPAVKKSKLVNQPVQPVVPVEQKDSNKMVTEEESKNSKDKSKEDANYNVNGRENSIPPKHSKPVARQPRHNNTNTTNTNKPSNNKDAKRDDSASHRAAQRGRMQDEVVATHQTHGNTSEGPPMHNSNNMHQRSNHRSNSREHQMPPHFFGYPPGPPGGFPPEMFPVHGGGHFPPRGYPPMPWMPHHHEDPFHSGGGAKPFHPYAAEFGGRMPYPARPPLGNFYGENYQSSRGSHGWQGGDR
jgi:serine/threonine protein kinase